MIRRIRAIAMFFYDFVVGDDWWVAAGVAAALALTYWLSHSSVNAWWLVPLMLAVMLPVSLWRAVRRG